MKPGGMSRALAVLVVAAAPVFACSPFHASDGSPFRRADYAQISVRVNQAVAPGIANSAGNLMITGDSQPLAAFQAALQTWSNAPGSAVRFAPLSATAAINDPNDNQNVIVFVDTPEIRSITGQALAVTLNTVLPDGRIVDSDTLFNPQYSFSTTLAPGTYDLQTVETHELGHVLGSNHSTVLSATMFQSIPGSTNLASRLSDDDVACLAAAYPDAAGNLAFGEIAGTLSMDGTPVAGASVVAMDANAGVAISALSASDGAFVIAHVPLGSYMVYAEPLDGPVVPANLYMSSSDADTAFSTTFYGGLDSPTLVAVTAGSLSRVSITARHACPLHIAAMGIGSPGGMGDFTDFGTGAMMVPAGEPVDLLLTGPGIDASALDAIRLLGPGLNVRQGSVRIDPAWTLNGMPVVRLTVDVAPRATPAAAGIVVTRGGDAATYTAALVIAPQAPAFSAQGIVNAATFQPGAVAPGELISVFGSALGPAAGIANAGFDPATQRVPAQLGGVIVTFDGVAAPLFYASATQINLQVPYETAGKSGTAVVIGNNGLMSAAVQVPVALSAPGIFVVSGGSQAVAINQDGSLNSASAPAPRGSVVTLFGTGLGVVSPPVATGKAASATMLSTAAALTVKIGGQTAPVSFAGLAPGMVGLMQVNAEIPAGSSAGINVPVQVSVDGATAQATIAVR